MSSTNRVIVTNPSTHADPLLPGYEHRFELVAGVRLHYVIGGNRVGNPVVLTAGFPQTWYAWRRVIPFLTKYLVIAVDLPGQGDSDRPATGYDTQTLAGILHGFLQQLGYKQYFMAAHDVGAWVAFPYSILYGDEIRRLAILDAGIPGVTLPDHLPTAPEKAWRTWHFAFHTVPDLPELMITGREREYVTWWLRRKVADPSSITDDDLDEYLRTFAAPGGLRAGLAYYRECAMSARQNQALVVASKGKIKVPLLALSADQGSIPDMAAPLREYFDDVEGAVISRCGHFVPEEQPEAVAQELIKFFVI